ncbi:MAG: DMT family transporter [Prolixibacteraceae bacterium]|jgi:drug/metabolite transporter (DMT)-like permease|nr:DMT family transporter [Prolixibacteraceae bacterium]
MTNNTKGVLYALTTMLFWGFLAIALKIAVREIEPFTIVWIRFSIAFIFLFTYFLISDRKQLRILLKPPPKLIIAALALGVNYIGFMLGIKYTSPSNAQVIIQIGPIILAIAGVVLFKEKIKKIQLLGFVVVILGFALFYSQQLRSMFFTPADFNKGVIFTVIGALAWVTYAILQKYLVKDYPPQTLNLFLFGLPALLYLPLANFENLGSISIAWWGLLLFLGANTLIAYGGMTAALKYLDANKVSTIIINNPIITFLAMAIFTFFDVSWIQHENFSPLVWLGATLFIAGAFVVVRSGKKN